MLWYENQNGQGNFGNAQVLSSGTPSRPYTVYGGDIDNDGDMDIAAGWLFEVGWFENLNGQGNFSAYVQVDMTINDAHRVELADVDNDNDLDILASTTGSDYVAWYENNPCVNFSDTLYPIACDSYTVPSGTRSHTSSGYYTDTLTNVLNCDSILRIQLTVNYSSSSTIVDTVCDMYTSPSGQNWTLSGVYSDTIPNTVGCDSVMTIGLTVNQSKTEQISEVACDSSYTSPSGQLFTQSGVYQDTISTVAGCDSAMTINLTINTVNDSVSVSGITMRAHARADFFQWLDCNLGFAPIANANDSSYTAVVNGRYAVQILQNGCIDTSDCFTINSVGTSEPENRANIGVFPNPNDGRFYIDPGLHQVPYTVSIYDPKGQMVYERHIAQVGKMLMETGLSKGLYYMRLTDVRGQSKTAIFRID